MTPGFSMLVALSCGRSLMTGGRLSPDGATPDGSPVSGRGDVADGTVADGLAAIDRPAPIDAAKDVTDALAADRAADRVSTPDASSCAVDCAHLPHVRSDVVVPCVNGKCVLPFYPCEPGFGNCSGSPNSGCETDLSRSENCGACGFSCIAPVQSCQPISGDFFCVQACTAPLPDGCGHDCFDFKTDPHNCGSCGNDCYLPNALTTCQQGRCVQTGCIDSTWADCTSDPGCETQLGVLDNCGACGDRECTIANTLWACNDGTGCSVGVCAPGYANCDSASPDCETAVSSSAPAPAGCLPQYAGTSPIATQRFNNALSAIAPDGSFFLAGTFTGAVDFDPSPGRDTRTATDADGYVTKFNADGSYAWTATFVGRGDMELAALAVTAAGGVLAAGSYTDSVDLDPGAAADLHLTATPSQSDPYVVELAANGTLVWARTFEGVEGAFGVAVSVATDATGAVYVAGPFFGAVDFDPGAGTDTHVASTSAGFLVKLTAAGDLGWARSFDDGGCDASLAAVAVASDGNIWATGSATAGQGCTISPHPGQVDPQGDVFIVKLSAAGAALGTWTIGAERGDMGVALAPGRDGSMYVAGSGSGAIDFDPGPAVARRWLDPNSSGNFVLKLDASGGFLWVRPMNGPFLSALASTADGGVLAAGLAASAFVTRFTAGGGSSWSIQFGGSGTTALSVSASGSKFLVAGTSSGNEDFDPGPAIDPVFGEISFISRYSF